MHYTATPNTESCRYFAGRLARYLISCAAAVTLLASAPAQTPPPGKGTLTGRVFNQATGRYASKAVVTVNGTALSGLSDDYGEFVITQVPSGTVGLTVEFVGQETLRKEAVVSANRTTYINFDLGASRPIPGKEEITLEAFVVRSDRYKTASEIAIAEEKSSPTLKNVVSADAFGDISEGNVGEFVKFIPGVQIGYGFTGTGGGGGSSFNNANSISIRGFGPEMTSITIDGVPLTNASPASLTRAIGLDMMTINNASRVEVIKVPTPDMPANTPGGSINLVSRSAFEYAKPQVNWSVMLSLNSENTEKLFSKTAGPSNKNTRKTLPGFNVSYVLPVNKKLGVSVSASWMRTAYQAHRANPAYYYEDDDLSGPDFTIIGLPKFTPKDPNYSYKNASGASLSVINPAFKGIVYTDSPSLNTKYSTSMKIDWRPSPSHKFAFGYTAGMTESVENDRSLTFSTNNGFIYDWGEDYATTYPHLAAGSTFNGFVLKKDFKPTNKIKMKVVSRDRVGATHTGFLDYTFTRRPWVITANLNASRSRGSYKDMDNGHFSEAEVDMDLGQLRFKDIQAGLPGSISAIDKSGNPVDWTALSSWKVPKTGDFFVYSGECESMDQNTTAKLDVARELDFLPWSWLNATLKTGVYRQERTMKKWGRGVGYRTRYNGPDGLDFTNYADTCYVNQSPRFNLPAQQWLSTYSFYELAQREPSYFSAENVAEQINNYGTYVGQQRSTTETSTSYYVQLSGKLFRNRVSWVTGARLQMEERQGYTVGQDKTPHLLKYADRSLYRRSNGTGVDVTKGLLFENSEAGNALRTELDAAGVAYPSAPIVKGTLEYAMREKYPFARVDAKASGKPTMMASMNINITKDLVTVVSWNRSRARPDLDSASGSLIGSTYMVYEYETAKDGYAGEINIPNPNLRPWVADCWDLALNYYTPSGGKIGVSGFYKGTRDFEEQLTYVRGDAKFSEVLQELGLEESSYEDYKISTSINGEGTAKVLGYELELKHSLAFLGKTMSNGYVFANYTHQYRKETGTKLLSTKPSANNTCSAGLSVSFGRFGALVRGSFVEEKYLGGEDDVTIGDQIYTLARYSPSMTMIDVNLNYRVSPRFSVFANARNILNSSMDQMKYDKTGMLPGFARRIDTRVMGVNVNFGVNGSF